MVDMQRKAVMKKAGELLNQGWHCSEAVLIAVGERFFDVTPEKIKLATPFAGGVAGTHEDLCGALTGGVMVIGGVMGRWDSKTDDQACMDATAAYRKKFHDHFDHLHCCDLKDNWVGKPGQPDCAELVRQAAGLLLDVLSDAGLEPK